MQFEHTRMPNGPTRDSVLAYLASLGYTGSTSFTASDLRPLAAWVGFLHLVTGKLPEGSRPLSNSRGKTAPTSVLRRIPISGRSPERDLIDARCFGAMLDATKAWEVATGHHTPAKPLREWLWFVWQAPRRPDPLIRSKYPAAWPWSQAARDAWFADPNHSKLIVEHTEPVAGVVRSLIDGSPWDPQALVKQLSTRLACVVVTKAEDDMLSRAGVGSSVSPDPTVSRYAHAGIDESGFLPLVDDPRWRGRG